MISVKILAAVYPTEDPEKVIKAISVLFTGIELQKETIDSTESEKEFLLLLSLQERVDLIFCLICTDLFAGKRL